MPFQDKIWLSTLAGIAVVTIAFFYVISQAGRQADQTAVTASAYALRRWVFVGLIILGIGVTGSSLWPFPIASQNASQNASQYTASLTPQIVQVVGHQWAWEMPEGSIHVGSQVVFEVTSADVNHSFGIYDSTDRLLAQTQAMPGVTNRLVYTFNKPGKFRIMCLEYCGLGHHAMIRNLDVVAGAEGQP